MTSTTFRFHPSTTRVRAGGHLFIKPHHYLPGLNLHSGELSTVNGSEHDLIEFHQPFPLKSSCPVPLLPPNSVKSSVVNHLDPSSLLLKEKFVWKKRLTLTKSSARSAYKKNAGFKDMVDTLPLDSNSEEGLSGVIPVHVSKLLLLYEDDPDSHFKGHYNWYYGNTLSACRSKKDGLVVISAAGKDLDELHIKTVKPDDEFKTETFVSTDQMIKGSPIYEVSNLRNKKFLAIRQKNRCAFLQFEKSNKSMKTLLCVDSKTPFVSVDASPFSKSEVCMIKSNRTFQVWDTSSSTKNPKLTGELPTNFYTADNWCNLHYGAQPNELLAADRVNVYLFDMRMDLSKAANQWNPWHQCEACEEVSLLRPSTISPVHCYVGTSHQVFSLDLRASFCQRWTHMMRHPPYVATCQRKNDTEFLLFSNQFMPGVECIVNDWTSVENPVSRVFPKILPSILDTYEKAKMTGTCNHPIVECRFDNCTTGLSAVKNDENFILFTGRSSGDIFYQNLSFTEDRSPSDPELTELEVKTLKQFEKKCWKKFLKDKKTLKVTREPVNLQGLVEKLRQKERKEENPKPVVEHKATWQMPKSFLEDCKDFLASKLLNVWNIKELPDWSIEPTTGNEPEIMNAWPKVIPPLVKKKKQKKDEKKKKKKKEDDKDLEGKIVLQEGKEELTKKAPKTGEKKKKEKEENERLEGKIVLREGREEFTEVAQKTREKKKKEKEDNEAVEGKTVQQEGSEELKEKAQKSGKKKMKKKDKKKEVEIKADEEDKVSSQLDKNEQVLPEINTAFEKPKQHNLDQPTSAKNSPQKSDVRSLRLRSPSISTPVPVVQSPKHVDVPSIPCSLRQLRSPSVPSEILGLPNSQQPCNADITHEISSPGRLQNAEICIKRSLSPDMFDATYIIPDRCLPDELISDSSTTSGFETDDTIKKRLKRLKKANKSNSARSSSSSNSIRKNLSLNLENSPSLLENVNLVASPNSKSFQQPTDRQTAHPHPRESPVEVFVKQESTVNTSFLDENNALEFLTPAATSTQAVSENRSAFSELPFSQPAVFTDSQILDQPTYKFEGQGGMNLDLTCLDYSPAVLSQPIVTRKRKISDSAASPKKNLRLSQSYTPGF